VKLTEYLLAELDREAPLTRRAIEAVPEGKDDWKPHQKSMAMGRLTALVAQMPSWLSMMIERDELDIAPATPPPGSSKRADRSSPKRRATSCSRTRSTTWRTIAVSSPSTCG
jgi:hypothetical protein